MTRPLDIGSALAAARRAAGMSQRDLGIALGVAQQQVARWEASGYRNASLERVDAAARAVGYETADLPLAAEAPATYSVEATAPAVTPVRDLGEIVARVRTHGSELKERYGIARIGVFGSFACGEQTEASDVDLLVEMPNPGGFLFVEAAEYMEQMLGRKVDVVRPQGLHPRLRDRILRDEIHVWSP